MTKGFGLFFVVSLLLFLAGCGDASRNISEEEAAEIVRQMLADRDLLAADGSAPEWTSVELYHTPDNPCRRSSHELHYALDADYRRKYDEADDAGRKKFHEYDKYVKSSLGDDLVFAARVWFSDVKQYLVLSRESYYAFVDIPGEDVLFGHVICIYVGRETGKILNAG